MSQSENNADRQQSAKTAVQPQADDLQSLTAAVQRRQHQGWAPGHLSEESISADPLPQIDANKPLRICITGYRSAPFGGGQGIYIKYLSKALVEAGHKVDVISGQPYPHVDSRVNLIKMPGLDLFSNGLGSIRPRHLTSFTNIIEWFSKLTGGFAEPYCFSRRLVKYLNQHHDRYDIIHDNQCLGWGMLQLQKQGVNLITTIHHPITSDLSIALKACDKWWERILIRRWHSFLIMQKKVASQLAHVVTVSQKSKVDIAKAFSIDEDHIRLVYNGIDTEEFRPLPNVEKKPWQLMATASADQPLKGLRFLLLALSRLSQTYPEIKLLLVGRPKPGGDTEQLIAKLGIANRIQFVHGISTEELVEHYAQSIVAVVPSVYEGFGLPAGEAMSCGVPVVSTNGGALPEVVGDAGIIVPVKDEQALADGIAQLLENSSLRDQLAQQGRQRIEQNFSWHIAASEFSALYRGVIAGSTKGTLTPSLMPSSSSNDNAVAVELNTGVANANG